MFNINFILTFLKKYFEVDCIDGIGMKDIIMNKFKDIDKCFEDVLHSHHLRYQDILLEILLESREKLKSDPSISSISIHIQLIKDLYSL